MMLSLVGSPDRKYLAVCMTFLLTFLIIIVVPAQAQDGKCKELQEDYKRELAESHKEIENYHLANLLRLGDLELLCEQNKKAGLVKALHWYVKADSFYAGKSKALGSEVDHKWNVVSIVLYTQSLLALGDSIKVGAGNKLDRLVRKYMSIHGNESTTLATKSDTVRFFYDQAIKIASNRNRQLWNCKYGSAEDDSEFDKEFEFLSLLSAYKESLVTGVERIPELLTSQLRIAPDDIQKAFQDHAEQSDCINSAYMAGQILQDRNQPNEAINFFEKTLQTINTHAGIQDRAPPFVYYPHSFDRRLADDLQYTIALLLQEQGKGREADMAFAKVLRFNLGSDHIRKALVELRKGEVD